MVGRTGDPPRSPGLTSDDQQCVGLLDEIYISGTQFAEKSVVPEKVLLPFSDTAASNFIRRCYSIPWHCGDRNK